MENQNIGKMEISLQSLLLLLSKAQKLVSLRLTNHNQQVAYFSYRLAQASNFPEKDLKLVFLAALVHDIGILSTEDELEAAEIITNFDMNHAV